MRILSLPAICAVCINLHVGAASAEKLADRYKRLACAVVELRTTDEKGTGFFINDSGRILTAAHVSLDREGIPFANDFLVSIKMKKDLSVMYKGVSTPVPPQAYSTADNEIAKQDISIIETGIKNEYHLTVGHASKANIGDTVISLGYPSSSPGGVLYSGFIASTEVRSHVFGPVSGNPDELLNSSYSMLRVQMPITPGASGAPLLDDNDQVIGIVEEIPVLMSQNIDRFISAYQRGHSGGVLVNGFDISNLIAELGYIVKEFESPGSGLAVPLEGEPLRQ